MNAYTVPIPSLDADDLSKMSVNEQKATVVSLKNLRLPLSFQKQLEFINYDVIVSSYMLRKSYAGTQMLLASQLTRNSSK